MSNPLRWRSNGVSPAARKLIAEFYAAGKQRVVYVDVAWSSPPSPFPRGLEAAVESLDAIGRKG